MKTKNERCIRISTNWFFVFVLVYISTDFKHRYTFTRCLRLISRLLLLSLSITHTRCLVMCASQLPPQKQNGIEGMQIQIYRGWLAKFTCNNLIQIKGLRSGKGRLHEWSNGIRGRYLRQKNAAAFVRCTPPRRPASFAASYAVRCSGDAHTHIHLCLHL